MNREAATIRGHPGHVSLLLEMQPMLFDQPV